MGESQSFEIPASLRRYVSRSVGRQRVIREGDAILLILHRPPVGDDWNREAVYFIKNSDGVWRGKGERSIRTLLESYRNAGMALDEEFDRSSSTSALFELLDRLVPLRRSSRNVHTVLTETSTLASADADLVEWINFAYETERGLDLLHEDIRHAIDARLAREEEAQTELSKLSLLATHRLNMLVALFLPLATIASVLGMNLSHGLDREDTRLFVIVVLFGILLGGWVLTYVRGGGQTRS